MRPEVSSEDGAPATTAARALILVLGALWLAIVLFNFAQNALGLPSDARINLLDVDVEASFYTWFSQLMLAGAGALLVQIGREEVASPPWVRLQWFFLGAVFFFLSADEAVGLHERLIAPVKALLQTKGALAWAWVVPYGMASAAGLIAAVPFLRRLPKPSLIWFAMAAATFLTGALGLEMVGASLYYSQQTAADVLSYQTAATLEEALEGLGALMFLHALMAHRARGARAALSQVEPALRRTAPVTWIARARRAGAASPVPSAERDAAVAQERAA